MFSRLVKSKSHPTMTAFTTRKDSASYCCNLMLLGVVVAIKFVVDHIIYAGSRNFLSRLELFTFVRRGILSSSPV
jgi:hypothetical protein